jgi:hypothetical protein
MNKANFTLAKTLGAVMLCAGAHAALAETVSVPASVTVNNAIDFTFTGTLDFGTVRAVADGTDLTCTGLELPANPTLPITADIPAACSAGEGDAVIQSVGGTPARPVFTVAGTAPFTNLTVTVPDTTIPLTAATGPGTPQFFLSEFTVYRTSGTATTITIDADGEGILQTNATGEATFTVGATLATHLGTVANTNYQDMAYTGTFDVEVVY